MDKNEILKAFYLSQITKLIEKCTSLDLLDLIYRLLLKETEDK